jgi:hypothetical protein
MKNTNNITNNETAQMMTVEAFLGALLIISAVLFVVSQAPTGVQQADAQSKTQLMHYGEDTIGLLKNSPPPEYTDYDNKLQYYVSENKIDELNEFINDTLPDNVVYNVELYDGGRYLPIIRNGYPSANGISFNEIIITKKAPAGGVGYLNGTYITHKSFDNGSLIIPMDEKQNNNITAYNLIMNISDMGIPVYQLLQDPRGEGFTYWSTLYFNATDDPWSGSCTYNNSNYTGGPYIIDVADIDLTIQNKIRERAENPIEIPSSKIDAIEFNNSMVGEKVNITFILNDSSSKTVNLSLISSSNINKVGDSDTGGDSASLKIDTTSIAFDDLNEGKIIGMIMVNNNASCDLNITNITIDWSGDDRLFNNITINGKIYTNISSSSAIIEVHHAIKHNDPADRVTVHKSGETIHYEFTSWLTSCPRIAVYPKAGTMTNYYSDSGISYTVLGNGNILNGDLRNYDILIMPHTNKTDSSLSTYSVVENIIEWVSDGGVLLAECDSIKKIDDRVEDVDQDNHTWYGFIGISDYYNDTNDIQLISPLKGTGAVTKYINLSESDGARLHPLAQSYTKDGTLPGTNGTISAFWLNGTLTDGDINPDNNILAVPQNESGGVAFKKITFVEAPFDKGTVIYLAGHDQSTYSQQRERFIFNSILYSTTAKIYSYGLLEIRITMWYK